MSERVSVSVADGVARVRLERPDKRNALDLPMFEAIAAAQRRLAGNRSLRAVVLEAAGEDFCSGLDIGSLSGDRRGMVRLLWKWRWWQPNLAQTASVGWRRLPVPVIAAIRGRCWGGGLQIVLGADVRIAEPGASLSIMEAKWGLIPDMGGTLALRELVGRDQATRLAMTADIVDGAAALGLGLVTLNHPEPESAAMDLARRIADRSPDAVAAVKRLYGRSWRVRDGAVLARETLYQWRILARPNQRIAVRRQRGEAVAWRQRRG